MIKEEVNHPRHYANGGIEVIDIIESAGWGEGFNLGNAVKYILRAGKKDPFTKVKDLRKAVWYINREIDRFSKDSCVSHSNSNDLEKENING